MPRYKVDPLPDLDLDALFNWTGPTFSTRTGHCLYNAQLKTLRDLIDMPLNEMRRIPNFGKGSFAEVRRFLMQRGLRFNEDSIAGPLAYETAQLDHVARRLTRLAEDYLPDAPPAKLKLLKIKDQLAAVTERIRALRAELGPD